MPNKKVNKTSLYQDKIVSSKSSDVMRKRFLHDLTLNASKFRSNAYDNIINQVENNGVKKNTKLFNEIKSFIYGDNKNITLKMIKSNVKENKPETHFPFAENIFDKSNQSISMIRPKKVFPFSDDIFGYQAPEPKMKQVIFSNKDFKISKSKYKNVAEERTITINEPAPEDGNLTVFMKKMSNIMNRQLNDIYAKYGSYKIVFGLNVRMRSDKLEKEENMHFHSGFSHFNDKSTLGATIMTNKQNLKHFFDAIELIGNKIEEFQRNTSDWQIVNIQSLILKIAKYMPAHGSSYIPLPEYIMNKKCCINIQNDDERCFEYSVLCGQYIDEINKPQRVTVYKPYMNKLKFDGIEFPVKIDDVSKFEAMNEIPINVFGLDDNEKVTILHANTYKCEKKIINLLLIENDDKSHYVYVKNHNALLGQNKCNNHICPTCLQRFSKENAIKAHYKKNKCVPQNKEAIIKELPKNGKHTVNFTHIERMMRVPFVIYADCEAILTPVKGDESKNTMIYQNHQPNHVGVKLVSDYPHLIQDEYKQFDGKDCIIEFLKYTTDVEEKCIKILNDKTFLNFNWKTFSKIDKDIYDCATTCHICTKPLNGDKVLDHCHITGKYRGPAHNACNVNFNYKNWKLPVIFHNLKNYDSHFIIQHVGKLQDRLNGKDIQIIPTTMDKYLSFTIGKCVFLDSCQFMATSLEKLVDALNKVFIKTNDKSVFTHFNSGFPDTTPQLQTLLRQKGVFPYDWFNSRARLNETSLPNIESFYSKLYEQDIEETEFERAQNVWKLAKCQKFYDYLSLYLKTDVLLLADVFESFRKMCLDKSNYGLDPCHYYTAPGFSWDAMLKMTGVSIECFQEGQDDMLEMIQSAMRGGVSMISTRYAKANNKYMSSYDESKPSSYISYLDANNLYGWAMSQYLPTGNFHWVDAAPFQSKAFIALLKDMSETGYVIECTLNVPKDKHDHFSDYPLAPESRVGEYSPTIANTMKTFGINQSVEVNKLIPNLYDKKKYVCHYRNLKLYLEQGLELVEVHRVLAFDQSDYLKKYIDFNTSKRAQCKNDFEKDLYKLFNNSVFGKTMENVEKRIDCSLVSDINKFLKLSAKPTFQEFRIYSEGLVSVKMRKTNIRYNRPMIVGMCILDLSKVLMYDFHYNHIKAQYGDKAKLLFTDTDSLCYHIEAEDVYKDMVENNDLYDFSDFDDNHSVFDGMSSNEREMFKNMNKKIQGKFKCESNGKAIIEFCGLRSKMYSFLTEAKLKCTAKGIQRSQIKQLTMTKYKAAIFGTTKEEIQQKVSFNSIRQNNHVLNTVRITKVGLSGTDNKRWVLEDNINTRALGHHANK